MKRYYLFAIIIVVGIGSFISCKTSYTPFVPIVFNGSEYSKVEESSSFNKGLIQVLQYYKEQYKIENNEIFVKKSTGSNKELMYNYTLKASDSSWLKFHKPKEITF